MPINYDNIPEELRQRRMWCCYRMELTEDGKPTKVPRKPNGGARAKSDEPDGWATFDEAVAASPRYDGVEIIVSSHDPYTCVDLDHCVAEDGKPEAWAQKIINDINSYTEFSQSGKGIHIIAKCSKPGPRCCNKKEFPNIEIYDSGRPLVMTGNIVPGTAPVIQPAANEIATLYFELFGKDAPKQQQHALEPSDLSDADLISKARAAKDGALFSALWQGDDSGYPSRNEADLALCNLLAYWTGGDIVRIDSLFRQSGLYRQKWDRTDYRDRTIYKTLDGRTDFYSPKAERAPRAASRASRSDSSQPDDFPVIVVSNRQQRDVTGEAIAALAANNDPEHLFVRAGSLARLRSADSDAGAAAIIDPVTVDVIRCLMSQSADYIKYTSKGDELSVYPPVDNAKDVLAWGIWPFPPLDSVVASPIVRPDGTIVSEPGYDKSTRLYYIPEDGFSLPDIPDKPSPLQIGEAKKLIFDVIADFPFISEADRANAIGMMLTPMLRSAIKGCVPFAIINAPQPGSGKGLLVRTINILTTGRDASMMTAPSVKEEWRKAITTHLMNGATFITIDNVESKLYDENLATVLTLSYWTDRVLGTNKSINVPNRACFVATGNNIKLGGDIPRRCYWVTINPQTSRPELRSGFRHSDLLAYVREHRGELVAALLTLVRGWYATGCPVPSCPIVGSFEQWSKTVGGVLESAGITGFLANAEERRSAACDDENGWLGFLEALHFEFEDQEFTTQEVERMLENNDRLASALPDWLMDDRQKKSTFVRKLGKAFSKYEGKCYGEKDFHIARGSGLRHKVALWKVETPLFSRSNGGLRGFDTPTPCKKLLKDNDTYCAEKNIHVGGAEINPSNPQTPHFGIDDYDPETQEMF
jgi:hypothetical protein